MLKDSDMPWSRPSSVPVGKVWCRFKGRDKNGQPGKMYQIRDMEPSDRKRCLDMMEDTFLNDEPLCQILDIKSDKESVTTIRNNWESYADQGICIACYTEKDGTPQELVGFNILVVKTIDDNEEDIDNFAGEAWRKLLKTLVSAENLVDVFEYYGVDKYLTSSGLTVLPEYRGQNIGAKIVAAREVICNTFDIKAAATVFTARSSQVLAAKCGYQQLAVLPYERMLLQGIDLTGCDTPTAILMARTY
ncbi:uncharacterized protein LOC106708308 [Papilio machaon]|uniref:uncharacterized protein LOC106708308 n=1 Tax=Papilio machaon TaxID=76193 RepID=UPI001E6657AB|nr:uncharacterized protein LOC106708308 [Papilio machaon]